MRGAGIALALETKELLYDSVSGQRIWLLRVDPDFSIPLEVHTSAEEGFLIAGDFRVGECLPEGPVVGGASPGDTFIVPPEGCTVDRLRVSTREHHGCYARPQN